PMKARPTGAGTRRMARDLAPDATEGSQLSPGGSNRPASPGRALNLASPARAAGFGARIDAFLLPTQESDRIRRSRVFRDPVVAIRCKPPRVGCHGSCPTFRPQRTPGAGPADGRGASGPRSILRPSR